MRTFTDDKGRQWVLAVDGWSVRQIKRETGYQILNAVDPEKSLFNDAALIVEVLWVLCRKQADNQAVSEEDFCRSIRGDSLEQSTEQLGLEIIDFLSSRAKAQTARQKFQAAIDNPNLLTETNTTDSISSSPESLESNRGVLPLAS